MPKVTRVQTAFTAGELAPFLKGRRDTSIYYLGCEVLRNVVVRPQGSAPVRPGLRFVAQVHAVAGHPGVRLLDHIFDDEQKYIVALYHQGCKVFRDADLALVATLATPYLAADLPAVDFVQVADTMLLAHPSYPLRQVTRGPAETWTTAPYAFTCPPQHKLWPDPGTLFLLVGALGAGNTVTLQAQGGALNAIFTAAMVGETWVLAKARFTITHFTNATHVNALQVDEVDAADLYGADRVKETAWTQQAATAAAGYFRSVAYHQNRLALGGTLTLPYWLWLSRSNAPYDFQVTGVDDAQPLSLPATTGRLDPVRYLQPGAGGLEVFTGGGEGYLPSSVDQPLTPRTIAFIPQSSFGCRFVKPVRLGAQTFFAQREQGAVREFVYNYTQQAYAAEPLTVRAAHLIDDPVAMTVAPGGFGLQADFAVIANRDGTGAVMTWEPTEQVRAWADLVSPRLIVDVRAVRSRVYVATRDGTNAAHWLEWMDPAARYDSQMDQAASPATASWTGFGHLAGKTADLWADGYWRGAVAVDAGGGLTTDQPYAAVSVGLRFDPVVRPMPPELEGQTLLGLPTRPVRAHVLFLNSAALRVNGIPIPDRPFDGATTTAPTPASTVARVQLLGWRKDGTTAPTITREGPFPFELLSLAVAYAVGPP